MSQSPIARLNVTSLGEIHAYVANMIKNISLICGLLFGLTTTAQAEAPITVPEKVIQLSVLQGYRTSSGTHMAALQIQMQPGWKTYWRAPGDGGIPPQFDWAGSKNIKSVQFHWPRPKVDYVNGMRSIGYVNKVVIPIEFSPRRKNAPLTLNGQVDLGVCKDVCVPVSLTFAAKLPADDHTSDPIIRAALQKQPMPAHKAGVKSVTCAIEPISDGLRVTVNMKIPSTGRDEITIIEAPNQNVWVSEAKTTRRGNTLTASSEMVPPSNGPFMLDRSKIRITIIGSNRAVDILGCTG